MNTKPVYFISKASLVDLVLQGSAPAISLQNGDFSKTVIIGVVSIKTSDSSSCVTFRTKLSEFEAHLVDD